MATVTEAKNWGMRAEFGEAGGQSGRISSWTKFAPPVHALVTVADRRRLHLALESPFVDSNFVGSLEFRPADASEFLEVDREPAPGKELTRSSCIPQAASFLNISYVAALRRAARMRGCVNLGTPRQRKSDSEVFGGKRIG